MNESIPTLGHYINGEDVLEGDNLLERRNPANNDEVVAKHHDGTPAIMNAAIEAAQEAFPAWSETSSRDRGEVIFNAAVMLRTPEWTKRFAEAMIAEIGKTKAGAYGEVGKLVKIFQYMSALGTHPRDSVINADQPNVHMYTVSEPVGVVGAISSFNFPAVVPSWKIAPALIAGNTLVLKPSPAAPMTSALLMTLFQEALESVPTLRKAGIGPGVINMVHGGPDIVQQLVENELVQAVSFTGSTEAGKGILRWAMNRQNPLDPRHFVAEMGGQNALVALKDANVDQAVEAGVNGAFFGEGQRCTATSRFVVDGEIYDEFLDKVTKATEKLKVGRGTDQSNEVGPLVSEDALERVLSAVEASKTNGMRVVTGGNRITDEARRRGNFMEPTILEGDPGNRGHLALHEEIFGPVAGICRIEGGVDEAIEVVNGSTHRHVASVFSNDMPSIFKAAKRMKVGMFHANNPTMGGDAQAPFGGLGGDTSYGQREMGPDCMKPFQNDKTVDLSYGTGTLERGAR